MAQVALDHGLNANLVHKWRRAASQHGQVATTAAAQFVPVAVTPASEPVPDIHIDLRRGAMTVTVTWPMSAAADCASWMRELLR